jgi:hypothetical protein
MRAASSSAEIVKNPEVIAAQGFAGFTKIRLFVQSLQNWPVDSVQFLQEIQLTFDGKTVILYSYQVSQRDKSISRRYIANDMDLKFLPGRRK